MPFELIRANYLQTSTQLVVNANTATAENVMTRDLKFQFSSDNFANDSTTVTMRINFDETLTVDRIALVGHNLKQFRVYYNGATANVFSLSAPANTNASSYATNSATSHYFRTASVGVTSVSIDMYSTIEANKNKVLGYLVISQKLTDFDGRVPIAQTYMPKINPQNVVHRLSDGGVRIQTLEHKFASSFNLDFVTEQTRNDLRTIFEDNDSFIFCPFGTTTSWDEVIYPCVWNDSFDFFGYSDNAAVAGFSGRINLLETSI